MRYVSLADVARQFSVLFQALILPKPFSCCCVLASPLLLEGLVELLQWNEVQTNGGSRISYASIRISVLWS